MKRTTYIMIALLVAGLLLTSGFAFYLTLETPSPERTELGESGMEQVRPLPVCKSVRLVLEEIVCRWKYVRPIRQAAVFRMFQVWKTV